MIATEIAEDRCDWHLDNWARWMRVFNGVERWYPSRASGGIAGSGSTDFDAMVAAVDARCGSAVDALIDDLPRSNRLAIYHVKLATEYREAGDVRVLYDNAKLLIAAGLSLRGIW